MLREMSINELYTHDITSYSPLYLGDITTQPNKAQLVTELQTNLSQGDIIYILTIPNKTCRSFCQKCGDS